MKMREEWRPVAEFPDYEVSNLGRVRRLLVLKPFPARHGYPMVKLGTGIAGEEKTVPVHRLVARAFVEPPAEGLEVNHRDGDKTNARAENLEWVTHAQNMRHALDTGLQRVSCGSEHGNARLTEDQARQIKALRGLVPQRELAFRFGVSQSVIGHIQTGRSWRHLDED